MHCSKSHATVPCPAGKKGIQQTLCNSKTVGRVHFVDRRAEMLLKVGEVR